MMGILLAMLLPVWEMNVINTTAERYNLNAEQKALLVAIRKAENGPRMYYGVTNPRCVGYTCQCRWAANTIRLRYNGNIDAFASRWCPVNRFVWAKNVKWFMIKQGVKIEKK